MFLLVVNSVWLCVGMNFLMILRVSWSRSWVLKILIFLLRRSGFDWDDLVCVIVLW